MTNPGIQDKSQKVSKDVVSSVASEQKISNEKLDIQLQIDNLRAQIGGTADLQKKAELTAKIDTLMKKKQKLKSEPQWSKDLRTGH
ncbi:hypothetical protein P4Q82_003971 [Salmonella enterica]|nr:hypothetical protein [Salmonella enterica]